MSEAREAMISSDLLAAIRCDFALPLGGIHGESHWARVRENGLRLAQRSGADIQIVELFAYLHDSKRQNDGWDQDHGLRAAEYLQSLYGSMLILPASKLDCLIYACAHHSDGLTEADVTVQTCWDADRLDLGRIGVEPDPRRLCTAAARDPSVIEWAFRRSRGYVRGPS
jgi:uncharacterized protein